MNYTEILEVLKDKLDNVEEFANGYYEDENKLSVLGPTKMVAELGGGEGDGQLYYKVIHFKAHDVYVKITGSYSSYNGIDFYGGWDCCSEVTPRVRSIITWEKI